MNTFLRANPWVTRLFACLGGGVVLAMMYGPGQGAREDYGQGFRTQVLHPRIFVFLGLGVIAFLLITFWSRVKPYIRRPGVRPLAIGLIVLVASFALMRWYDNQGDGKFGTLRSLVVDTSALAPVTQAFFSWIWLVALLLPIVLIALVVILGYRWAGWVAAGVGVVAAVLAYVSHAGVVSFVGDVDHSFGADAAVLGFLILAFAGAVAAVSKETTAQSREFLERVMAFRPGLPLAVLGLLFGLIAYFAATWFDPSQKNLTLVDTRQAFRGYGLAPLAVQYLAWLGYVLFAVTVVLAFAAVVLRRRVLGWAAAAVAVVSILLTVFTLRAISALASEAGAPLSTGTWSNLGTGGWVACIALFSLGAGGVVAALGRHPAEHELRSSDSVLTAGADRLHNAARSTTMRSVFLLVVGLALFYPPTASQFWQRSLVTDIGVYVLLAIGLNVVIGWAGLLDLGFIAFYAIGSYTTAYLTGSLPIKPNFPHWLEWLGSPLWAIPVAVLVCLIAGTLLGAPTLRLRGDYLAIVTLGFGEIIRIVAVNNPGNFTNGPRGTETRVPNPVIDLGFVRFQWGQNPLQYWYLLLVIVAIVLVLFYRLEGSRLGRAWAAIREDEIAAQATGVNTTRVKLLAFAIGASTSGLAGVFFASQIGYFNPQNFILNNSILVVAYVVFGGMGSLPGAIAGAAALTWLPQFLRDQVPAEDRTMWIGAVLLIMMIFRPQGLIPARRRKAELLGLAGHDTAARPEEQAVPSGEGLGGAPAQGAAR